MSDTNTTENAPEQPQNVALNKEQMVDVFTKAGYNQFEAGIRACMAQLVSYSQSPALVMSPLGKELRDSAIDIMHNLDALKSNREIRNLINEHYGQPSPSNDPEATDGNSEAEACTKDNCCGSPDDCQQKDDQKEDQTVGQETA